MRKINYKQDAISLAKDLLGKVICYNGKEYMITVTEAYPYDEGPDKDGKEISYVNRDERGDGYRALVGKDKIGTCFSFSGMLHVACKGGMREGEYRCGNVLIRGGILIENNEYQPHKTELNYKEGCPYILCKELLKIPNDFNENSDNVIKEYKSFSDDIKDDKRVRLNSDKHYRFYLDLDELKCSKN